MENGKRGVALTVTWSAAVSAAIALIAWGSNSERITNLEKTDVEVKADVAKQRETLATHSSAHAVTEERYKEILRRLDELKKLREEAK